MTNAALFIRNHLSITLILSEIGMNLVEAHGVHATSPSFCFVVVVFFYHFSFVCERRHIDVSALWCMFRACWRRTSTCIYKQTDRTKIFCRLWHIRTNESTFRGMEKNTKIHYVLHKYTRLMQTHTHQLRWKPSHMVGIGCCQNDALASCACEITDTCIHSQQAHGTYTYISLRLTVIVCMPCSFIFLFPSANFAIYTEYSSSQPREKWLQLHTSIYEYSTSACDMNNWYRKMFNIAKHGYEMRKHGTNAFAWCICLSYAYNLATRYRSRVYVCCC